MPAKDILRALASPRSRQSRRLCSMRYVTPQDNGCVGFPLPASFALASPDLTLHAAEAGRSPGSTESASLEDQSPASRLATRRFVQNNAG